MSNLHKHFLIQHEYAVTADESAIDQSTINYKDPEFKHEMHTLYHRLFQAIIAHKEVLQAVFEYQVLATHQAKTGDAILCLESQYGNFDYGLIDLLLTFSHIFTQEDREFLTINKDSDGALQELENCFHVLDQGWEIVD